MPSLWNPPSASYPVSSLSSINPRTRSTHVVDPVELPPEVGVIPVHTLRQAIPSVIVLPQAHSGLKVDSLVPPGIIGVIGLSGHGEVGGIDDSSSGLILRDTEERDETCGSSCKE